MLKQIKFFIPLLLISCTSYTGNIDPGWTREMFFKNAQIAMDSYQYKAALYYYDVFLVRYSDDPQNVIAAEYERAFIYYKMGKYKEAEMAYNEIIQKYESSPYAALYHPRFRQLSEIGLQNIEKQKAVHNRLFWRFHEKNWAEKHGESLTDDGTV